MKFKIKPPDKVIKTRWVLSFMLIMLTALAYKRWLG